MANFEQILWARFRNILKQSLSLLMPTLLMLKLGGGYLPKKSSDDDDDDSFIKVSKL